MEEEIFNMNQKENLSQRELGLLIALSACILGGAIRLYTAYKAGFPINDGGLFYLMTKAIQQSGYLLPKFVYYNGLEIPFAYPPFGFYFAGITSDVLNIPLIEIFRWLPAVILSSSIYAFYILASRITGSSIQAGVAAIIYSLLPRSITYLIMGGGITRSFGQLFLIITAYNFFMLFSTGKQKYLWYSTLSSTFVCLAHPEATIHSIGIVILFWFFKGRSKKGFLYAVIVATSTFLLTSIWWLPVILRFGTSPFFSAVYTSLHNYLFILYFFIIPFSDEPFLTIIILFAIIGIAVSFSKRDYLLPLFYVLPLMIEPRNAENVNTIPMSMLASVALCQLILPGLSQFEEKKLNIQYKSHFQSKSGNFLLAYLMIAMIVGMLYFSMQLSDTRVTEESMHAFEWVSENTPIDSHFLIVTGNTELFRDWNQEWFPVLTKRISVTTIQGREWLDGHFFSDRVNNLQLLQSCIYNDYPLKCVEAYAKKLASYFDYIYISKAAHNGNNSFASGNELIFELSQDRNRYTLIYKTDSIVIFKKK